MHFCVRASDCALKTIGGILASTEGRLFFFHAPFMLHSWDKNNSKLGDFLVIDNDQNQVAAIAGFCEDGISK